MLHCPPLQFTFHRNIVASRTCSIKGPVKFPQTYTHGRSLNVQNTHIHTAAPPPKLNPSEAWLHQDDWKLLSQRDKDSVSWDDVTASFHMGVNLCLVEQQQKIFVQHWTHMYWGEWVLLPFFFVSPCDFLCWISLSHSRSPSFLSESLSCFFSFNWLYFTLPNSSLHFLVIFHWPLFLSHFHS